MNKDFKHQILSLHLKHQPKTVLSFQIFLYKQMKFHITHHRYYFFYFLYLIMKIRAN